MEGMTLANVDLLRFMPDWMQDDVSVQGLSKGVSAVLQEAYQESLRLTKWDKIETATEEELDEYAWEHDVKWDISTASVESKIATIQNSDKVHQKLGTKYSIEQVIQDYFGDGDVEEWFEYDGKPGHFRVRSKNINDVADNYLQFLEILDVIKRKSAWLDSIVLRVDSNHDSYAGMMCHPIRHSTYTFEEASN